MSRRALAAGWSVEGPDAAAVKPGGPLEADALIACSKPATAGPVILLTDIGAGPLNRGAEVETFFALACDDERMLDWAGFIAETEEGEQIVHLKGVRRVVSRAGERVIIAGSTRFAPSETRRWKALYAAFQLAPRAGAFAVTDLHVSAARMKQSAAPAAPSSGDGAAALLRASIAASLRRARAEHKTPYYDRLERAIAASPDLAGLAQAERTLCDVDARRYGMRPPANGPFVSIVMPAHNRAELIKDAIASVLAQTYGAFELIICDDASDDATVESVRAVKDRRVTLVRHDERKGAAAARNSCLAAATGDIIAYLDTDNLWHPRYLELMLDHLAASPGHVAAYASYFDVRIKPSGEPVLTKAAIRPFFLEDQIESPYVDLNSFIHRRELTDVFGGFDDRLVRRQDYDLFVRYCWSREPLHVPFAINLYQRIDSLEQISRVQKKDETALELIRDKVATYYSEGVEAKLPDWVKKVTVLSWDLSRNHFAKPYSVAEALSKHVEVELISFQFFDEAIFPPLAGVTPPFELKRYEGGEFPAFFDEMTKALNAITGDVIYAVKPRLPSLGLALLANYHTGKPVMLEANDLETVVNNLKSVDRHADLPLGAILDRLDEAKSPHALVWSKVLDRCVRDLPTLYTHNINLNIHYGRRGLQMRNIKDDAIYDPAAFDREALRAELGFSPEDRVILFGGLVRKHKGVFELVELLRRLNDPRYKLVFIGNRESPELRDLAAMQRDDMRVLPPQTPERMAALNLASDLVILWLDPKIAASHYQSPYKMSDALAMGPAIIASPTSDQANFSERDLMWMAPFGDFDALLRAIEEVFADPEERARRRRRARQFFRREFSYKAVTPSFALGASLIKEPNAVYPISAAFAEMFAEFHRRMRG